MDAESGGPKKPCIRWGAHWRHVANMIKPSMCADDATFLSNYYDQLLKCSRVSAKNGHYPAKLKIQISADSQQIWKKMQTQTPMNTRLP